MKKPLTVEFEVPGSFGIWLVDQGTLEITEVIFSEEGWAVFAFQPHRQHLSVQRPRLERCHTCGAWRISA